MRGRLRARVGDVEAYGGPVVGSFPATMHTGPLGSTIHVLRADAGTVAELAAIDWNRRFRQVCLDPVRGIITLMTPSRLHGDLAEILGQIVDAAGSVITGASKGLRDTRLRRPADPPGTGLEPDCAFYVGDNARAYRAALVDGESAADAFFERTPPDLVVEVEITNADAGKVERYRDIGVRELWRLHGRKGTRDLRVEFLALGPGTPPRSLAASRVLGGLTAGDVREAVDRVRLSLTADERKEAVARVVRRRRAGIRVREEGADWGAPLQESAP